MGFELTFVIVLNMIYYGKMEIAETLLHANAFRSTQLAQRKDFKVRNYSINLIACNERAVGETVSIG